MLLHWCEQTMRSSIYQLMDILTEAFDQVHTVLWAAFSQGLSMHGTRVCLFLPHTASLSGQPLLQSALPGWGPVSACLLTPRLPGPIRVSPF